ncbi:MAG TPA: enoyl-CoA hydratase-related protein [Burkholderiales bacterium]|nr:enoyl-CoA hydratase-related protein [Burkholderiales bacterium]
MSALPELKESTLAVDGRVATLTFQRDEIRNALTGSQLVPDFVGTCEWANRSGDVSVLIVTGAGSAFSAGGNIKNMRERHAAPVAEIQRNYRRGIQQIPLALDALEIPVIAAVNGPAIGAGCDLALMCDIRIASTQAQFGETFVNLGIIPGDGGSWFLTRAVGYQRAAEMTFTGRIVKAAEAKEIGLALEVVEPAELLPRAAELAQKIAAKPPQALRLAKRLLQAASRTELAPYLDLCAAFQAVCHKSEDHAEALTAFFEKRSGNFTGR